MGRWNKPQQPPAIQTPGIGGGAGTRQQVGLQRGTPGAPIIGNLLGQGSAPVGGAIPQPAPLPAPPLIQGSMVGQPQAGNQMMGGRQQFQRQQPRPPLQPQQPPRPSSPTMGPGSFGPPQQQMPNQYSYAPQQGQSAPFSQQMANAAQQPQPARQMGPGNPTMGPGSFGQPQNQSFGQPQQGRMQPQQQMQAPQPQPMGPFGQQPGGMNIQTSIQPQGVYGNQFMQQAGNMAAAQAVPAMGDLRNMSGRPGLSLGSGAIQAGMGQAAGQMMGQGLANQAAGQQQMGWQNANNNLAGQQARSQEALGWGNLQAQGMQNQLANQNAQQGQMYNFLRQAYGGI